jgi:hypothetical protein
MGADFDDYIGSFNWFDQKEQFLEYCLFFLFFSFFKKVFISKIIKK